MQSLFPRKYPVRPLSRRLRLTALEDRSVPAAGGLDAAFGGGGRVTTNFQIAPADNLGHAVAVQVDGKIVVAGNVNLYSNQEALDNYDFAVSRYNPDGSLDPTFGSGGRVTVDFGTANDGAHGVAVAADGRIVVVGYSGQGGATGYDVAVARLTADGALDLTFGTGGKQTVDLGSATDYGNAVAVRPNGSVVVAGETYRSDTGWDFAAAQLTPAGQLDSAFGTGGVQAIDFGATSDHAFGVALQGDGKVVLAGTSYRDGVGTDATVARLTAAGTLDSTFGTGGAVVIEYNSSPDEYAYGVAIQADGKIVVAGQSYQGDANGGDFAVARLTTAGVLDGTFGTGGKQTIDLGSTEDYAYGIAVQADGKIMVGGTSRQADTGVDVAAVRLTASGALDSTFGTGGKQTIDFGSGYDDFAFGLALDGSGRAVLVGDTFADATGRDLAVARLTTAGQPDATFGSGGRVTTDFTRGLDDQVNGTQSVVIQPDGKIVVVGYTQSPAGVFFGVSRYNPAGSPDAAFGTDGQVMIDFGSGYNLATSVALDAAGNILVAGVTGGDRSRHTDFAVVRLTPTGSLDTTFGTGGKVIIDYTPAGDEYGAYDNNPVVAVDSAGNVVLIGTTSPLSSNNSAVAAARLTPAGQLDPTFGTGGKATFGFGARRLSLVYGAATLPDGSIVISAQVGGIGGSDFGAARLTPAGALDPSFGTGGLVTVDFGGGYDAGQGLAVQADGKIVLAGTTFGGDRAEMAVARLMANGSPDTGFGTGGQQTIDFGTYDSYGSSVAVAADGSILVGGSADLAAALGTSDYAVARLTADGAIDSTFGTGGHTQIDFAGGDDFGGGIAVQPDGKIVVAGYAYEPGSSWDFGVARLVIAGNSGPTVDAGGPYGIVSGGSLTLAGSGSDPDGDALAYTWTVNGHALPTSGSAAPTLSWADLQAAGVTGPGTYPLTLTANDGHGGMVTSGPVDLIVAYDAQSLTDLSKPLNAGRTIALKLELLDASGNNISSAGITVTAIRLDQVSLSGTRMAAALASADTTGPQRLFRYVPGQRTYFFNLKTKGLAAGEYEFVYTVAGDPTEHVLRFRLT
jgi:uncharacterized delta-60 repeat protein